MIIRAIAKKYKLSWRTPLAPHSQQTRTMLYESKRVPPNFLRNMAATVYGLRFLLREAIEGARRQSSAKKRKTQVMCGVNTVAARQYRLLGRSVLDPEMLLFISMRYDHRRQASLRYAQQAQSVEISGLDKVVMQEETDVAMMFQDRFDPGRVGHHPPCMDIVRRREEDRAGSVHDCNVVACVQPPLPDIDTNIAGVCLQGVAPGDSTRLQQAGAASLRGAHGNTQQVVQGPGRAGEIASCIGGNTADGGMGTGGAATVPGRSDVVARPGCSGRTGCSSRAGRSRRCVFGGCG